MNGFKRFVDFQKLLDLAEIKIESRNNDNTKVTETIQDKIAFAAKLYAERMFAPQVLRIRYSNYWNNCSDINLIIACADVLLSGENELTKADFITRMWSALKKLKEIVTPMETLFPQYADEIQAQKQKKTCCK